MSNKSAKPTRGDAGRQCWTASLLAATAATAIDHTAAPSTAVILSASSTTTIRQRGCHPGHRWPAVLQQNDRAAAASICRWRVALAHRDAAGPDRRRSFGLRFAADTVDATGPGVMDRCEVAVSIGHGCDRDVTVSKLVFHKGGFGHVGYILRQGADNPGCCRCPCLRSTRVGGKGGWAHSGREPALPVASALPIFAVPPKLAL